MMKHRLFFYFHEGLRHFWVAKTRTLLSLLGIWIGVASVVALLTMSRLAAAEALSSVKALGEHWVLVVLRGATPKVQAGLLPAEWQSLLAHLPGVTEAATFGTTYARFVWQHKVVEGPVLGGEAHFAHMLHLHISAGRYWTVWDARERRLWLGEQLAQQFNPAHPQELVGQTVQVGEHFFRVMGLLSHTAPVAALASDLNQGAWTSVQALPWLHLPMGTSQALLQLSQSADVGRLCHQLQTRLIPMGDVRADCRDSADAVAAVQAQARTLRWLLGAIASIALLVGGVGVMNVLLMSVLERRREIAIRLTIGAVPYDIVGLFFVEAFLLTGVGGILGVCVGEGVAYGMAMWHHWAFSLQWYEVLWGIIISCGVGIMAGAYPAYRASKLDPAEILQEG
ncbi:MAG: hypothetical protein A3J38_10780 [Gammaproteobacteria bacterium RIFCSPHIGHO2_12_FULL_45_9]|nr:MAG: hypothetical protein A3J38_10780 [Gammaproteobacteria bacterium RIFCSPHIGHO2_12_FULL_45_9]